MKQRGRGKGGGMKVALHGNRAPMKQRDKWAENCFAWKIMHSLTWREIGWNSFCIENH